MKRRSCSSSLLMLLAMFHCGFCFAAAFQVRREEGSRRRWARASPSSSTSWSSSALAVIQADAVDFDFDVGLGGVRLAQETAVVLSGPVQHAPGKATASLDELQRYNKIHPVPEATVMSSLQTASAKVIATGRGKELYKDPGSTTVADVTQSPKDAARDALAGAGTALDCGRIHINFMGGHDLQYLEVLEATQQLVLNLDVKTKCKVSYQSLSDGQFPSGAATVTVVGWTTDDSITEGSSVLAELSDLERSVALGRLFFRDGTYYTYLESDRNSEVA